MTGSPFRRDIQALRALAVTLVVIQHYWPSRLHGGYIGVDVFFVISGFLITSHLSRELEQDGRIRLGRFYARRVRRLLPAAFTVLIVGSVLVLAFMPFSTWERTSREVVASAFYFENWTLASSAVDYSAAQEDATIAQHYWSLSVEEQFYLLWPLLLWGCVALWRRFGTPRVQQAGALGTASSQRATTGGIGAALLLVVVVSYPLSVWWLTHERSAAYFVTPGRLWEFAVGAAVSLLPRLLAQRTLPAGVVRPLQLMLTAAGWAGLAYAAVAYNSSTPFPGQAALLPVLATAAIIAAGCFGSLPRLIDGIYGVKPIQWMGDISYSVYLWHWPLVVVAPAVLGLGHPQLRNLGLYALTLVLAHATFHWIEPLGKRVRPTAAPWKALTAMAVGMGLIAGLGAVLTWGAGYEKQQTAEKQRSLQAGGCVGASALLSRDKCDNVNEPVSVTAMADVNKYWVGDPACKSNKAPGALSGEQICDYSGGDPKAHVAYIVGDSHAQHWQGGLIEVARHNKWKLYYRYYGGCAIADVPYIGYTQLAEDGGKDCREKAEALKDRVLSVKPNRVLYSIYARRERVEIPPGSTALEVWKKGLPVYWKEWAAAGMEVDVIADPPLNGDVRDKACLSVNPDHPENCAVDRVKAIGTDPLRVAAKATSDPKIRLIDTTDAFCDERKCYAAVGGVAVYYNQDHLNREYARLMWPYLSELLTKGS